MVDFRYHIVSIVAIFLALAIGIVLGAGPLKTTSDAGLKTQVSDLRQARNTLQGNLGTAQNEITFLNSFGEQVAPALLAGRLAGFDVAVVSAPGASASLTSGLITSLGQAGAFVSVRAQIGGNWTDPDKQAALADALAVNRPTATATAPPSVRASSAVATAIPGGASTRAASPTPSGSSPTATADPNLYLDAGVDLAHALLTSANAPLPSAPAASAPTASSTAAATPAATRGTGVGTRTPATAAGTARPSRSAATHAPPAPVPTVSRTPAPTPVSPATAAARILDALVAGGFVSLTAPVPRHHPSLAVVVAADPPQNGDAASQAATQVLASLAEGLREGSDGTVVAGDAAAAGSGGLLSLIRASKPGAGGLSTVDSSDSPVGRIAVPLALLEQQTAGKVGQYGEVGSTNGPLPRVSDIGP